jgi:hypothetical protein
VEPETADGNIQGCESAERPYHDDCKTDFFVRFTECRLLEGFARLDDASGQRHLPTVPVQRVRTDGQYDVGAVLERKDQQQACCVTDSIRAGTRKPVASGLRSHERLSRRPRQGAPEARFQAGEGVKELHS